MPTFTLPQICFPPSVYRAIALLLLRWRDLMMTIRGLLQQQAQVDRDFWSKYLEKNDHFRQTGAYWYKNSNEVPGSSWNLDYSKYTKRKGNIDVFFTDLTAPSAFCSCCFTHLSKVLSVPLATVIAIRILFWHLN